MSMNLSNYVNLDDLKQQKDSIKKIFFYRVCGTGMAAAACILKEAGYDVYGADNNFYPPMSDYLKTTNIPVVTLDQFKKEELSNFDLIVVGNVVRKDSEDSKYIEDSGTMFCSFPALLGAFILNEKKVVGIAGTHGKTTTTFLFTQVFEKLGYRPGYFIGGVMDDRPPAALGKDNYFFIESDEYDSAYFEKFSKFLSYEIDHVVFTSLEFDHGDIYKDIDEITEQFIHLYDKQIGCSVVNFDYDSIKELMSERYGHLPKIEYGFNSKTKLGIIDQGEWGTKFSIQLGQQHIFETNLVGKHNILNLSSVILFALWEGIDSNKIAVAVKKLKMVKRRQEVKGKYLNSIIIDDFAHHPTAVKTTVEAIKTKYQNYQINAVFEPASATARSSIFQDGFAESLSVADEIFLMPPPTQTTVKDSQTIDINEMKKTILIKGKSCNIINDLDTLIDTIKSKAEKPNVWLIMSNGKCQNLWESEFVKNLSH